MSGVGSILTLISVQMNMRKNIRTHERNELSRQLRGRQLQEQAVITCLV